jgi:RNA polymerase sigma-70 factor, ECF subfamily
MDPSYFVSRFARRFTSQSRVMSEPVAPSGNLANQSDAELYQATKAGVTRALGVLYQRHAGLVYGLALKALGNPTEAEDLTQDIFLNLSGSTAYDSRRGSLRTFLGILTRSRAIDRLRSRQTVQKNLARWHPGALGEDDPTASPFEQASRREQFQEVQTALAQLAADEQQLLRLAYYDGFSQSEIAAQLQIPLGTVKTKTRRGLCKLRQALSQFHPAFDP